MVSCRSIEKLLHFNLAWVGGGDMLIFARSILQCHNNAVKRMLELLVCHFKFTNQTEHLYGYIYSTITSVRRA